MEWLHALFSVLASFRLVTLFTQDAIWQPVRARTPLIPWHCALCMSVWAAIAATVFLLVVPYANWPLAISWLYLAYERMRKVDSEELTARVNAMHAEYGMTIAAMVKRSTEVAAELTSAALREKALRDELEALKKTQATA